MIYNYLFFISLIILLFFYYNKDKRVFIIAMLPLTLHFIKNYMKSRKPKKLEHFDMDKLNLQITKDDLFIIPVSKLLPINCCCEEEDAYVLKLDKKVYTCFSNDKCVANNIHRYYWHLFLNNFTVVSKKKIDNYNPFAKYNNMEVWHVGTFKTDAEAQLYVGSLFNLKLPLESSYQYSGILGLDKDFVKIVKVSDIVPDCLCINDSDMKSIKDNSTKIDTDLVNFFKNREKTKQSLDGLWQNNDKTRGFYIGGTTDSLDGELYMDFRPAGQAYSFESTDGINWYSNALGVTHKYDGNNTLIPSKSPWGDNYSIERSTLTRQNIVYSSKTEIDGEWKAPVGWSMKVSASSDSNNGISIINGGGWKYIATKNADKTWKFAWNSIPFLYDGVDKLVPTNNVWAPSYSLEQVTLVKQKTNQLSKIETIKSGTFVSNELCLKYNIYNNYWTQNINNYVLISYKQFDNYYNFGKHELKPVWHIKTFKNQLDAEYYMNKLFNLNKEPDSVKIGDTTFTIIPVSELVPDNCCLNSQGMIALNELNPKLGFNIGCVKGWGGNTPEALQYCIDNNIYINYWIDNSLGYAIVSDKKYKDYRNFAKYKNIPVWHVETYLEFSKAMVALKTKYNKSITNESSKSYTWQYVENGGKTLFNLDKESGDVQCLSYDGKNCLWGFVDAANDNPTYSKRDPVIPLKCGEQHMKLYNSIGYNDTTHWCSTVFNQLMKNSQEAYDYNDWSVYKTQYINNKRIEPISSSSQPGITIYSEPYFKGKSLFLPVGFYNKQFFDKNWTDTTIGSWKSPQNNDFMVGFGANDASGGSTMSTVDNLAKIFGGHMFNKTLNGIKDFNMWTPEQYKKYWCKETGAKTYNSHWPNIPSSDCNSSEPGLTIYSEPNFQGKSLFLPVGNYDKPFFDRNWNNTSIASWKSPKNDDFMIEFLGTDAGGGSVNTNLDNLVKLIGFHLKDVKRFSIFTPDQYKKKYCKESGAKTFNSHWLSYGYPTSNCADDIVTNKTWNINWTPKIGFINFMKGNDVALHFNIRDNITVFNAWTSSTRSWGAEQNTYDFNNTPRPLNVKVRFNINKFEIVYQDKIISFPNRFNISNAEDITIISDNGITYNVEILSPEMMALATNTVKDSKTSQIARVNMGKSFAMSLIVNLNAIESKAWTEVLSITGIKDELPLIDGQINSRILSLVIAPNTNLLTVIIGDNKNYTTTAIDMNNKFELPINKDTLIDIVFSKNKFKIYKNNILFSAAPLPIDRTYPNEAFIYSSYVLVPMNGNFRNLVFISSDGPLTVHDLTLNGVFIDSKNSLIYLFCNNILLLYKFKGNNLEFSEKVNETRFTITNKRKIDIEDKKLVGFEYINPNIITVNNQSLTRYYPKETITINNDSNKTLLRFNNSIYGDIPNQSKLAITNNNFTIEFWYYQLGNEGNNTIIDKGDYEYLISINPNNQTAIGFYNRNMGWWYVYFNIPINKWTHIAISYIKSESKLSCLVNGTEINNIKLGVANLHSGAGNVNIGRQSPISCACNLLKNAIIYDLRIWGVTRNQPDIANNMLTIQKINSDGLISNFLMDDKKDIIIDRVSGFNATIVSYLGISNYSIVPWFPKKTEELIDYNITVFSDGIVSLIDINSKLPIITALKLWSVDINTQKVCKKYLKEAIVPVVKLTDTEILNIVRDSIVKLNNITINFEKEYNKLLLPKLTNEEINIVKASLNQIKFNKTDNTNFLFGKTVKNRENGADYKYLGDGNSYSDCENLALKDSDINKITSISWFNSQNGQISNNCFGAFNDKSRTNQLGVISGIKDIKQNEITNQPIEFMISNPVFKTNTNNLQSVLYVSSPLFTIYAGVSKLEVSANVSIFDNDSNVAIRLNTLNNSIVGRSESIVVKSGKYVWTIQSFNLDSGTYYLDFITTNNQPFNFYGHELNPKFIACEIKQYREYNNLFNLLKQQGVISQGQQQQSVDKPNINQQININIKDLKDDEKSYVSSVLKNIIDNHKEQILIELNYNKIIEDLMLKKTQNTIDIKQRDSLLQNIEQLRKLNDPLKINEINNLQKKLNEIISSIEQNTKKIEELNNIIINDKTKIEKTEKLAANNITIIKSIEEMIKKNPNLSSLNSVVSNIITINAVFQTNIDLNTKIVKESKIPESKITKISGKFTSNGIEKIEILDANNPTVYSGTNDIGTEFSYECPDNSYIIGYDYGINKTNTGSSIFSGLGPIYCSDGTVIKKKIGKDTDTKVGIIPKTIYSQFDYQTNMIRTDDTMGVFNNVSSENCATICSFVDKCESFSFNDNKCTIYNNNNNKNLQKGGKTYNKLK